MLPAPISANPIKSDIPGAPARNPNLDSFDAVMKAMDAELEQARKTKADSKSSTKPEPQPKDKGKGKARFVDPVPLSGSAKDEQADEDEDIEEAMSAELQASLRRADSDSDEDDGDGDGAGMDYNLIKNFLESFKSQGGLSGPVSTLAGRLDGGRTLPRDSGPSK